MSLPEYFISCDWGTTNFRLQVVETETLSIIAEHKTNQGVKTHFEAFTKQGKANQFKFFSDYLLEQIQYLPLEHKDHLIILSGMASSNIGLCELPYTDFPIQMNGSSLYWKQLTLHNDQRALLISGAKGASGIMRGEEIQAVGLAENLIPYREGILILPGTHSKHMTFDGKTYTGLKNYMTGELFEVLSRNSILARSVKYSPWTRSRVGSFKEGLTQGLNNNLSASLLSIRTNHVIGNAKEEDGYYYLSGILIGDELSYLKNESTKVILAAPESVSALYELASETIFDSDQYVCLGSEYVAQSLLVGQKKILKLYGG